LQAAFKIPYACDFIAELYRKHTGVIEDHENANIRNTGKGGAREEDIKRIKLSVGQVFDR
jgi:hypothetical protein